MVGNGNGDGGNGMPEFEAMGKVPQYVCACWVEVEIKSAHRVNLLREPRSSFDSMFN